MRTPLLHLLLLTALCGLTYLPGLTAHGLTNWQEAQRALVAREMQSRSEWIVPTVNGRPYLAKPPMIYWWQLAIAKFRGAQSGELELRLTVALAGWLGVIALYLVARRAWQSAGPPAGTPHTIDPPADRAALWASLFLATGLLYVRSARIGELDILLVPFTVAAVGGILAAWRTHLVRARSNFAAVGLAVLASIGAMLTKGPPSLLVIGLAGYGGIALWEARAAGPLSRRDRPAAIAGAVLLAAAGVWQAGHEWSTTESLIGAVLFAVMGGAIGVLVARLARPSIFMAAFRAYARTHPVAVLGLPFLALWGWGRLVTAKVGAAAVNAAARGEAIDNLRPLDLGSPLNNLEAAGYGVGLGSVAALGALLILLQRKPGSPRLASPGMALALAWVAGGLIAFSLLGKGVPRYLTPVWPGIALLGGWGMANALTYARSARRLAGLTAMVIVALAIGQSWWYGLAREARYPDRSPRAMVAELLAKPGVNPRELAAFEFQTPALDFYVGVPVEAFGDVVPRPGLVGLGGRTIADLRKDLQAGGGSAVVLIRRAQSRGMDPEPAWGRLEALGLTLEEIPLTSRFTVDNRRTEVAAVRVRPSLSPAGTASPVPGS